RISKLGIAARRLITRGLARDRRCNITASAGGGPLLGIIPGGGGWPFVSQTSVSVPIAPQVATRIPATNNQTFLLRTNAAHASRATAARASRSISLKYSTKC